MSEPKPLPCPFCGETERLSVGVIATRQGDNVFVECNRCGCRGPTEGGDPNATPDWNRRAPWTVTREEARKAIASIDVDKGFAGIVEALGGKVEG